MSIISPPNPVLLDDDGKPLKKKRQENASTGATAASIQSCQGYARAINPNVMAGEKWSWRMTSPALLASAVVLPPLLANTFVGAILYTSYLQFLGQLHPPSSHATKRVDPLPPLTATLTAGFLAGSVQSLVAAPVDALQIRFHSSDFVDGKYHNMWQYAWRKSQEIGVRGIFAGWSLSLIRDSFGAAAFFATFEYIKGQMFYAFVSNMYGQYGQLTGSQKDHIAAQRQSKGSAEDEVRSRPSVIKPHYMIEPTFILLAGVTASIAQALILFPISRVQEIHYGRLVWIDAHPRGPAGATTRRAHALGVYASAYRKTIRQCFAVARREGGMRRWLYRGFLKGTLRQVPSTSAGLIVFEVFRRKYSSDQDEVRISKDGYDILLV
nr:mitochondrial ornithine transporter 1 [Quercus suber]